MASLISKLAKGLGKTQTEARMILKARNVSEKSLTEEIVDDIISIELTGELPALSGSKNEPTVEESIINSGVLHDSSITPVGCVSYLELAKTDDDAKTYYKMCKDLDINPNAIPEDDVAIITEMVGDATILQAAGQELEQSKQRQIEAEFEQFQLQLEQAIANSEIAAVVVHTAGQQAYHRRLAELKSQATDYGNDNRLQSDMIATLLPASIEINHNPVETRKLESEKETIRKKKNLRAKLISAAKR